MDERRRVLNEWLAWREREEEELKADRRELGLPETLDAEEEANTDGKAGGEGAVVEEIVEEVLDEIEEVA